MNDTATSKSWPDVASEIIRTLGKAAPMFILVAGLLYAGYYFYELTTQARIDYEHLYKEKLDTAQAKVDSAQKKLIEHYEKFEKITSNQILSIEKLMNLRDHADKKKSEKEVKIASLSAQLKELENQSTAAGKKATMFKADIEKAKKELSEKRVSLDEAQKKLKIREEQLNKSKKELEIATDKVMKSEKRLKGELLMRANQIEELRKQLTGIVHDILSEEISDDPKELARTVLKKMVKPEIALKEHSKNPTKGNLTNLAVIVGLSRDELKKIITENKGLGYPIWLEVSDITDPKSGTILTATSQDEVSFRNVIGVEIEDNLVVSVENIGKYVFFIRVPKINSWENRVTGIGFHYEEEMDISEWYFTNSKWTFKDLFSSDKDKPISIITGEEKSIPVLNALQYKKMFPEHFKRMVSDAEEGDIFGVNLAMAIRSDTFDSSKILSIPTLPEGLREDFNNLVRLVLKRKKNAFNYLAQIEDQELLGRFSTLILRKDFQIVSHHLTENQGIKRVNITYEYNPLEKGTNIKNASSVFQLHDDLPKWRLVRCCDPNEEGVEQKTGD